MRRLPRLHTSSRQEFLATTPGNHRVTILCQLITLLPFRNLKSNATDAFVSNVSTTSRKNLTNSFVKLNRVALDVLTLSLLQIFQINIQYPIRA